MTTESLFGNETERAEFAAQVSERADAGVEDHLLPIWTTITPPIITMSIVLCC